MERTQFLKLIYTNRDIIILYFALLYGIINHDKF